MQLHVGFWIITLLTSVLTDLFDVEFKMDLSYFAGGRCTTLSRNSMVSFSERFQSLSLQVASRKILSLHNHMCVIVNMYLKHIESSEGMGSFNWLICVSRLEHHNEINTGFTIRDLNP